MDTTVLCICGKPDDWHGYGKSDHPFTAPSWPSMTRDTQRSKDTIRNAHYALTEQRLVTIAAPAAGVDLVATIPDTRKWKVWSLSAQFTTSAAVANRVPHIVITAQPDAKVVFNVPPNQNQPASGTATYSAGAGVFAVTFDNANVMVLPVELELLQKWTIGFSTTNLQAGDQWSAMSLLVTETLYF